MLGVTQDVKTVASFLTLEHKVTQDLSNTTRFPEIAHQAVIRRGLALCPEEKAYVAARKLRVRDQFARYMNCDSAQVHPDDVPTIAFGGSGGGYRAMLSLLGYSLAMKQAGLWDLLTYISGVSGSCECRPCL